MTRGQTADLPMKQQRLIRRLKAVSFDTDAATMICAAVSATMEVYPLRIAEGSSDLEETHSVDDVSSFVRDMLPAPSSIFTTEFFSKPLYPLKAIFEMATLYGLHEAPPFFLAQATVTPTELENQSIPAILWFSFFMGCTPQATRSIIDLYRGKQVDPAVIFSPPALTPSPSPPISPNIDNNQDQPSVDYSQQQTPYGTPHTAPPYPTSNQNASTSQNMPARQDVRQSPNIHQTQQWTSNPADINPTPRVDVHGASTDHHGSQDVGRKVYFLQQAFKDSRFTGELHENIEKTIFLYDTNVKHLGVPNDAKAELFIHILDGAAWDFYRDNVTPGATYDQVTDLMVKEYNSDSRRIQVRRKLESLTLTQMLKTMKSTNLPAGLTAVVNEIAKLSPQCHPDFRTAAHKIEYLRRAVVDHSEWSLHPIQTITSHGLTFNGFTTALHEALVTHLEITKTPPQPINPSLTSNGEQPTLTNVTKYGRHPRHARRDRHVKQNNGGHRTFEDARRRGECFRCGGKWEYGHKCARGGIRNHLRQRLAKGTPSVHIVSELIKSLEFDDTCGDEAEQTHAVDTTETYDGLDEPTLDEVERFDACFIESHISAQVTEENEWVSSQHEENMEEINMTHITFLQPDAMGRPYSMYNALHTHTSNGDTAHSNIGFCVDIGAPRSVAGLKSLHRAAQSVGINPVLSFSRNSFRFADAVLPSLGMMQLPLSTPTDYADIMVEVDVVEASIPVLLGMDALDKESLTPCTVTNRLINRVARYDTSTRVYHTHDRWTVPLVRSESNHLYAALASSGESTHFTRTQLSKIHKNFFHPSAEKLFALLKRARPEEATPRTLEILKELTASCEPCQKIQTAPRRFKVTMGADTVRFNERILMDLMYLDGSPVLHIVDEGTRFAAARFLQDASTRSVWKAITTCWVAIYTGLPNRILVDQGTCFAGPFVDIARESGVEVEHTGLEAHTSLGLCERYHQPLRTCYRKVRLTSPDADRDLVLACCVKALNDTLGPEGLVPSALLFGEYPRVHTKSERRLSRPTNTVRAITMRVARDEAETVMAKQRLARSLKHAVSPASNVIYDPGDAVLVWREKRVGGRIGEWIGPFKVAGCDVRKKMVYVHDAEVGPPQSFNLASVKRFITAQTLAHTTLMAIVRGLSRFSTKPTMTGATEIIAPRDPRSTCAAMEAAKVAEVEGLMARGTFKIMEKADVPRNANMLGGRFVLALKTDGTGAHKYKARFVLGGHRDKLKDYIVHSSRTIQPSSVRLLLVMAKMYGWDIWSTDIRQAYLQSTVPLDRAIFVHRLPPAFGLKDGECMRLVKPLYGLCESGDLWHQTLDRHHRTTLGMKPAVLDPALYFIREGVTLHGISATYVDDILRCGSSEFMRSASITNREFDTAENSYLPFEFTGFLIDRHEEDAVTLSQKQYLMKVSEISNDATFSDFRSVRMKMAWVGNSRPDCLYEIAQLAQVTETQFQEEKDQLVRRTNRFIRYAKSNNVSVMIPKLDRSSLRVLGFADASFANKRDGSTQLGYIIFVADGNGRTAPLVYKSYKAKRITRSVMAGEAIAFGDMADVAICIATELGQMTGETMPVQLLTDSKCLFDVISRGSRTSERRLMLDISAARESFRTGVISDVGLVRSTSNVADGLTKAMSQATLRDAISMGRVLAKPVQWIIRTHDRSSGGNDEG